MLFRKEVMDTLISITSNWQAWAVWIVFMSMLIIAMHYFTIQPEYDGCWCEYEVYDDPDDWTEFMLEHQYECTK